MSSLHEKWLFNSTDFFKQTNWISIITFTCNPLWNWKITQNSNDCFSYLISAQPTITEFVVQDYYFSISNHSLSCTASFGDDSTLELGFQLCLNNSYKPITDVPAFTLSQSSDDKALDQCTNQRTVAYYFNFTQVTNGTSLRCLAIDQNLNITVATNCIPLVLRSPGKTHLLITFQMNM